MNLEELLRRFEGHTEYEQEPCDVEGCPNNSAVWDNATRQQICLAHFIERAGLRTASDSTGADE